ncbi:hypothetical protein L2E82_12723 [Cichorium intybus]|uniref:Uncharacterized protein n=1 Tax=Cichorium intybus TaxID=13427 RepID=A0ACB9GGV5_CICIN|nr:hypothetical protein L2E82_12723 [Cichorium intybus]
MKLIPTLAGHSRIRAALLDAIVEKPEATGAYTRRTLTKVPSVGAVYCRHVRLASPQPHPFFQPIPLSISPFSLIRTPTKPHKHSTLFSLLS